MDTFLHAFIQTLRGSHGKCRLNGVSILRGLIVLFSVLENVYLLLEQTVPF